MFLEGAARVGRIRPPRLPNDRLRGAAVLTRRFAWLVVGSTPSAAAKAHRAGYVSPTISRRAAFIFARASIAPCQWESRPRRGTRIPAAELRIPHIGGRGR